MTDVHISLPPALRRALDLLADPPADPDASKGYLDLLGAALEKDGARTVPKNTGAIQAAWASPIGSMLYDNAQAVSRRLISAWQHPVDWLDLPHGGTALDVGSGPGNVTASLAEPRVRRGWRWASTSPSRCWHAPSALKRDRTSASSVPTRNDFRCATTLSTPWSRSPCCSWFRIRRPRWQKWRGCCDQVAGWP